MSLSTLSKREKTLAAAVAVLGGGFLLWIGSSLFSGPSGGLRAEIAAQTDKLEKLQEQVHKAAKMQVRMAQWKRQALPSDESRASSLYQDWLLELAGKAGFRDKKVLPTNVLPGRGETFHRLPFTVQGQASLDELITFLYEFYTAGHLHEIRSLTLKPTEKKDLNVIIQIEALSLPTADRKDRLCQLKWSELLTLGSLDEYHKVIGGRNFLSPYHPPPLVVANPADTAPKTDPFDASKYAYVTGIVEVSGRPQVWVKSRTTDEKFQLHQGDKLQIGPFSATVARIDPRDVELDVGGKRQTIPLGGSLHRDDAVGRGEKGEGRGEKESGGGPKPDSGAPGPMVKGPNLEGKAVPPMFRGPAPLPGTERAVRREHYRVRSGGAGGFAPGEGH